MTAVLATVALPAAALTIWALLRSPLGLRLVAEPRRDRWHERQTPLLGGVGLFAGLLAGVGAALAAGALHPSEELFGILGGCAIVFTAGLLDQLRARPPSASPAPASSPSTSGRARRRRSSWATRGASSSASRSPRSASRRAGKRPGRPSPRSSCRSSSSPSRSSTRRSSPSSASSRDGR